MSNCVYQKSALSTVTTAAQTVAADGVLNFTTNDILTGCSIQHTAGGNTAQINCQGLYQVAFNADFQPTGAGDVTMQLYNNGVAVPGAEATVTAATGDTYHVAFVKLIKVLKSCPCIINNTASLQVQVSAAATVTNANLSIVKLA